MLNAISITKECQICNQQTVQLQTWSSSAYEVTTYNAICNLTASYSVIVWQNIMHIGVGTKEATRRWPPSLFGSNVLLKSFPFSKTQFEYGQRFNSILHIRFHQPFRSWWPSEVKKSTFLYCRLIFVRDGDIFLSEYQCIIIRIIQCNI